MNNILLFPTMIVKHCAKCARIFKCAESSKQEFCCRYCEYSWVKASGDARKWQIKRREAQQLLTLPKDLEILKSLNFNRKA